MSVALHPPGLPRTNLSLFTGGAGLELGLRRVLPELRTLGYCEREAYAAAVLVARMAEAGLRGSERGDERAAGQASAPGELVYAEGDGRVERRTEPARLEGRTGAAFSSPPREWPPGPDDVNGWADVLAVRPDLAPAIEAPAQSKVRGVVDGLAGGLDLDASSRVDRLRLCGNGVVPTQAALAFVELYGRFVE